MGNMLPDTRREKQYGRLVTKTTQFYLVLFTAKSLQLKRKELLRTWSSSSRGSYSPASYIDLLESSERTISPTTIKPINNQSHIKSNSLLSIENLNLN